MCASPFKFITAGPPPPRVVLLPDALFFSRPIPVTTEAAEPRARAADVASQVELAFEALAPFPLAQLYYGYFWADGANHALAFAAYRRRFTAEQTDEWIGAELILPAFAAVLRAPVEPATTVILSRPEGLTAIHWGDGQVPTRVVYRPLVGEVPDEQRAQAREALLRGFESKTVIDVAETPAAVAGESDGEYFFRAGALASRFSAAEAFALDVRDKGELAALRRARRRDVLLWRTAVGCVIAFGCLLLGQFGLFAGGLWQTARRERLALQAPAVERIQTAQEIANHIEDLRTKRLLTIEMINTIWSKLPQNTYLLSVSSSNTNLYTVQATGQTSNPAEISLLQDGLQSLPQVAPGGVTLKQTGITNSASNFVLTVTFRPGALKPSAS